MKVTKTVVDDVCDICETEHAYYKCLGCGKLICYDCVKDGRAKEYSHSVYFSGSEDGRYCLECDKRLPAACDPLHASYRVIKSLRDEQSGWYEDFKKRVETAESNVKRHRAAVGKSDDRR